MIMVHFVPLLAMDQAQKHFCDEWTKFRGLGIFEFYYQKIRLEKLVRNPGGQNPKCLG